MPGSYCEYRFMEILTLHLKIYHRIPLHPAVGCWEDYVQNRERILLVSLI